MKREKKLLLVLFILVAFAGLSCTKNSGVISTVDANEKKLIASPADKSIELAQNAVNKDPELSKSHLQLAAAYLKKVRETGDYSINRIAEISIAKALEIEPDSFEAQVLKAQIYLSEHKFAEALKLAEELEKTHPNNTIVYAIKTDALTELGRYEEAVDAAQKFVDMRPDATSYTRVAHLRSLHGDIEGAIEARKMVIRITDPNDPESIAWAYSQLGKEYFDIGNFSQAEVLFNTALKLFPDYHWALAGKGKVLAAQNKLPEAARVFEKLRNRVPETNREIYLGDIYMKMGREADAQKIYKEVANREKAKENGDMHRIALLWADHNVNLDVAVEIARADRAKYDDLLASDTYAWALYKKGEFAKAKDEMKNAMRLNSKNALFFYHLGMIENKLQNFQEAARYLTLALKTNPSFDLIQADIAKDTLGKHRK